MTPALHTADASPGEQGLTTTECHNTVEDPRLSCSFLLPSAWLHLLAFGSYPLSKIEFTFLYVTAVGVWVLILIYFKV